MKSENASIAWIAALSGPKQWTSDDAKRVLAAWKNSGESMAGFAHRHGLNARRIAWSRERLASTPVAAALTVAPVTVRAEKPAPTGAPLSLVVAGGVRVVVNDATRVPPHWFAAVVDALSRASP